jgi:hypothetical protein
METMIIRVGSPVCIGPRCGVGPGQGGGDETGHPVEFCKIEIRRLDK